MKKLCLTFLLVLFMIPALASAADVKKTKQETLSKVDTKPLTATQSTVIPAKLAETPAMKCQNQVGKNGIKGAKWDKGECKITACDEPKYKLKNNKCVSECTPTDPYAKTGEMQDGKCVVKTCKNGYELKEGECTPNEKQQQKDAKSEKKKLCDKTDGLWRPTRDIPCECKNGKTWTEDKGCRYTDKSRVETLCQDTGGDWDIKADKCICQPPLRPNANDMFCYDPRPNCKKEEYSHSKTVTWNDATNECEVICDDDFYFHTPSNQCEAKSCEVKDKDPNAKTGEIRNGKCIITACDFGYNLTEQRCTENLCKQTGGEPLERFGTPKETCNCGDKKWDDSKGCVEKTQEEIKKEQEACVADKIAGATAAEWNAEKQTCTITCDEKEYEQEPVDGKCVKKPSDAYKTASDALKNLLKQAQAALTALTEQETKETKTTQEESKQE